jgi:hypothetical protein
MIIILACYVVLYTFPNTGGVYAATIIATSFAGSWYPMMCTFPFLYHKVSYNSVTPFSSFPD